MTSVYITDWSLSHWRRGGPKQAVTSSRQEEWPAFRNRHCIGSNTMPSIRVHWRPVKPTWRMVLVYWVTSISFRFVKGYVQSLSFWTSPTQMNIKWLERPRLVGAAWRACAFRRCPGKKETSFAMSTVESAISPSCTCRHHPTLCEMSQSLWLLDLLRPPVLALPYSSQTSRKPGCKPLPTHTLILI